MAKKKRMMTDNITIIIVALNRGIEGQTGEEILEEMIDEDIEENI